jgi:hypothetical protein
MKMAPGGEIMQTKFKTVLAASGFALAAFPGFAVEMPTDGSKNFSSPTNAPSYFANETVPEPARVDHTASFTSEDVAAVPEDGPAVSEAAEPAWHGKHASQHSSAKHSASRSRGHGASTHYATTASSKSGRTATAHSTGVQAASASRSASAARGSTQTGAGKTNPVKHAKSGNRQHASVIPSEVAPLLQIT